MPDDQDKLAPEKAKVVLVSIPQEKDKYEVGKALASQLGITFEEADELIDQLPVELLPSIPIEAGETFAETIRQAGAEVEVLPIGPKAGRFCTTHPYRRARARCKEPNCDKYICEICVRESHGKLLCPECYRRYKRRRIVTSVGVLAGIVILVALWLSYGNAVSRLFRYLKPLDTTKVAVVLVARELDEGMAAYYQKITTTETGSDYAAGEQHSIPDIDSWFQREFSRITGEEINILEIDIYGLYEISDEVPRPAISTKTSLATMKTNRAYLEYFNKLIEVNNLKLDPYRVVLFVELTNKTGIKSDFMEYLGMAYDRIGYVKFPISGIHAHDYYVMSIAHYIARLMGATVQLDANGFPIFPQGYAEPQKVPRFPQEKAEIMGCYIPIKAFEINRIISLDNAEIGLNTAYQLGWISSSMRNSVYNSLSSE